MNTGAEHAAMTPGRRAGGRATGTRVETPKMMPRSPARRHNKKPITLLFLVVSAVGIEPTTY